MCSQSHDCFTSVKIKHKEKLHSNKYLLSKTKITPKEDPQIPETTYHNIIPGLCWGFECIATLQSVLYSEKPNIWPFILKEQRRIVSLTDVNMQQTTQ